MEWDGVEEDQNKRNKMRINNKIEWSGSSGFEIRSGSRERMESRIK